MHMMIRQIKYHRVVVMAILLTGLVLPAMSSALDVNITADLASVEVMHNGQTVTIMRSQNQDNTINPAFARTSRHCPPFCIQPMELAPGVRTIGELEMLQYLENIRHGDRSILVIDSRSPRSANKGTIPGSVNIPAYTLDTDEQGADSVVEILTRRFGAKSRNTASDFSSARTLVLFCNGPWCSQSSTSIKTLLKLGYPADKLIWYRGGMQSWESLGLTTVKAN